MMRQFRRTKALISKNLLLTVNRRPVSFILTFYVIPLVLLTLLLLLPSFLYAKNKYGVASPIPIRSLAETVQKKLVIIQPKVIGSDIRRVIDTFTKQLSSDKLLFLDSEDKLLDVCPTTEDDRTDCHAAITFIDSPETTGAAGQKHTWSYSIRSQGQDNSYFDATKHESRDEAFFMPLQLAINNAISNSTTIPQAFMFSHSEAQEASSREKTTLEYVGTVYTFVIFACFLVIIYQLTRWITEERESGLSSLVDSMGGGWSSSLRVLSWILVMDMICLPLFILFGVVYWRTLFHSSDVATLIVWQILLGFSIISSTAFAAAFFYRARVSSIFVAAIFLAISVATQLYISRAHPEASPPVIISLSMLFPSSSHALFIKQMTYWQTAGQRAAITEFPPGSFSQVPDVYAITQSRLLLGLLGQTVIYPILAIFVEWGLHGISFSGRTFSDNKTDKQQPVANATGLQKRFWPGFWTLICCCGKRRPVTAVSDVTLQAHRGQIMCLAGPNGSGKTTTLHMLAGFIRPTAGSVSFTALPSQIGICPQQNTLWDELTVREHVKLWSRVKCGRETPEEIDSLIESCNLTKKRDSFAKTLSGGQKRKLQLACMFVGDSAVCLIDECTSGLDPLSRRVIWDTLLQHRANRSIVFTTHFLDEVDVLADYIVVITNGMVKCQGSPTELNNKYGGGYKVMVNKPASGMNIDVPWSSTILKDSIVYATPDSRSAADLSATLADNGVTDVTISGPQFEDVFLNLAKDNESTDLAESENTIEETFEMTPGRTTSFMTQVIVLLQKRFMVLPRFWWPYLYAVLLVVAITPALSPMLTDSKGQKCAELVPTLDTPTMETTFFSSYCAESGGCHRIVLAPQSANDTLYKIVKQGFEDVKDVNVSYYGSFAIPKDNLEQWQSYVVNRDDSGHSGIYTGSNQNSPIIAYQPKAIVRTSGFEMLNLWSEMNSGIQINAKRGSMPHIQKETDGAMLTYIIFFTLVQAIYPAIFVLYPAIEKHSKTKSMQYANGVRRGPAVVAHTLFDLLFILFASIFATLFVQISVPWWVGRVWDMLPILLFYGLSTTLIGHGIVHFTARPLKTFLVAFTAYLGIFVLVAATFLSVLQKPDRVVLGVHNGLSFLFPLGNVFRALIVGFNVAGQGCHGGLARSPGSFSSITGPAITSFLQVMLFTILVIWLEGGFNLLRTTRREAKADDFEMHMRCSGTTDVEAETVRVERSREDLLKSMHVTKSFDSNLAVDDVTFGISPGEVLALLGPNGAGKSTLVNMIQSEISPNSGRVLLCNEDARAVASRKFLGVCPQYDALDLLTVRQHLVFYAKIKGVKDINQNVSFIMNKLGLQAHSKTKAAKLSGGNKRKLSLAIALMGTPPVLVLDEPTTAMDAMVKRAFWKIIQSITPNRSVLITTHSMEEADALASRATILAKKMLAIGTPQELRTRFSNEYHVSMILASAPNSTNQEMNDALLFIKSHIQCVALEREMLRGQIRFTMPSTGSTPHPKLNVIELSQLLEQHKADLGIEYYSIGCPTLENAFLNAVQAHDVDAENEQLDRISVWQRGIRFVNRAKGIKI